MISHQTLRIPRGLWADLEESVIQQDRQFLSEVARSLGLPVQEVLRKCLGSGTSVSLPIVLEVDSGAQCPWWCKSADGCWKRCTRRRKTQLTPCQIHMHAKKSQTLCLDNDPYLTDLPTLKPLRYKGSIYWIGEDTYTYREDGSIETDIEFCKIGNEYVALS